MRSKMDTISSSGKTGNGNMKNTVSRYENLKAIRPGQTHLRQVARSLAGIFATRRPLSRRMTSRGLVTAETPTTFHHPVKELNQVFNPSRRLQTAVLLQLPKEDLRLPRFQQLQMYQTARLGRIPRPRLYPSIRNLGRDISQT